MKPEEIYPDDDIEYIENMEQLQRLDYEMLGQLWEEENE